MKIQINRDFVVRIIISERLRFSGGSHVYVEYTMEINDKEFYVCHRADVKRHVTIDGALSVEEYLKELGADEALECVCLYWRLQNELLLASSDIDLYEV